MLILIDSLIKNIDKIYFQLDNFGKDPKFENS